MSAAPVTPTRRLAMSRARKVGMVEQRRGRSSADRGAPRSARVRRSRARPRRSNTASGKIVAPAHQARETPRLVPEDVEERVRDQVAVAGPEVGPVAPVEIRAQRLAVRHHDAFRVAGRARREHDVARIVGTDRRRRARRGRPSVTALPRRDELVPGDRGGRRAHRRAGSCARARRASTPLREQRGIVGVEEPAHGEQHPRAAAREDVRRFGAAEARVDRNQHATRRRHPERGDDPLEGVRRPDRDAVAALDARREQRTGRVGRPGVAAWRSRRASRRRPRPRPRRMRRAVSRTMAGIVGQGDLADIGPCSAGNVAGERDAVHAPRVAVVVVDRVVHRAPVVPQRDRADAATGTGT